MWRYLNPLAHWYYAWYLIRHKWYVFLESVRLDIPIRGLFHDWSKFLPDEWFPYVRYFYIIKDTYDPKKGKPSKTGDAAFDMAWLKHQRRNNHHWQWWTVCHPNGRSTALPMSDGARREMAADWMGAARVQKGNVIDWYKRNREILYLHPETREWVELALGYRTDKELEL